MKPRGSVDDNVDFDVGRRRCLERTAKRFDVGEEKPLLAPVESMAVLASGSVGKDGLDEKKNNDASDGDDGNIEDRRNDSTIEELAIMNDVQIDCVDRERNEAKIEQRQKDHSPPGNEKPETIRE
jgi:hypothetical protein